MYGTSYPQKGTLPSQATLPLKLKHAYCSNILYPCEDKANRTLLFACRNCDHKEESTNNCVYRHEVTHIPR
ncbi:hypothetical protein FB645_001584 [Coemansia sp. IMI 203386]|nr:hypothetical protein FB645_001584 [Coemansia sp. IMI 203386]